MPIQRVTEITQEAWIVFQGTIQSSFYDLDNSHIEDVVLKAGDCAILFRGGHKLTVLENDSIMYEIKTGPYHGKMLDKQLIK